MKKDKKIVEENLVEDEKMSFFRKLKEDKKYSAKIQLASYGLFILIIVVLLNVGNSFDRNNNIYSDEEYQEKLIDRIDDNYSYDVNVSVVNMDNLVSSSRYYGKVYDINSEIVKESNGVVNTYYKVNDYYYAMNESELSFVNKGVIYELVDGKYLELDGLLEMINKASLDHVANTSDGVNEYVYNLMVSDVVISVKNNDVISFNVKDDGDKLNIIADYTNLIKVFDNSVSSVKVSYDYSDIDLIEEFSVIKDDSLNME